MSVSAAWNQRPEPPTTTAVRPAARISSIACVRQLLELADGALAVERPDADETRTGVLIGEDRKPAVDLHRVGGDELCRNPLGDRLCNGGLARRGWSKDAEDSDAGAACGPL